MKPEYEPKTIEQKLGYVVEECGEVLAAIGKAQRWGLGSCNPELPIPEREYNRDWVLRELEDLSGAILRLRTHLMMMTDEELERHGSPR
jgi:NTP pyrophosphatase (non-canonical NTP hydrolase)